MDNNINLAPFYIGQKVIAVDALPGSRIQNGNYYTVRACYYHPSGNPIAKGKSFWYVEITMLPNHSLRPSIFAAAEEKFETISLEKILENETAIISSN